MLAMRQEKMMLRRIVQSSETTSIRHDDKSGNMVGSFSGRGLSRRYWSTVSLYLESLLRVSDHIPQFHCKLSTFEEYRFLIVVEKPPV
jgi:hypothetical protein